MKSMQGYFDILIIIMYYTYILDYTISTSRNNISFNYADLATADCPEMDSTHTILSIIHNVVVAAADVANTIPVGIVVDTIFGTAVLDCFEIALLLIFTVFRMVF